MIGFFLNSGVNFTHSTRSNAMQRGAAAKFLFVPLIWFVSLSVWPLTFPVYAQDIKEEDLKAAYIYNFLKLTEFPAGSLSNDIKVCVVKAPGQGHSLNSLQGKLLGDLPIDVTEISSANDSRMCNVYYFLESIPNAPRLLKTVLNKGKLTIGDTDDFTASGGVIRFFDADGKIRFEINLSNAKNEGLKFSSKLLSLAVISGD